MFIHNLKEFFTDSILGILLLSIIGAILGTLILKLIAVTNRNIKLLWVFYSEGNKKARERLINNQHYFNYYAFLIFLSWMFLVLAHITAMSSYVISKVTGDKEQFIYFFLSTLLFFIIFMPSLRLISNFSYALGFLITKEDLKLKDRTKL